MYRSFIVGLAATAMFIAFLLLEQLVAIKARRRFRVVIHVNGTRGKSTVTRMIHAVLREAGYQAWGKTTGTEPRLLLPDGAERVIRRIAPANVREQRNMALRAAIAGADALVFECNAVRPELQRVSSEYLKPDLLVITNARLDHRPEQGSAEEAAMTFAATIPVGGAVASSDMVRRALWQEAADSRNARFLFVDPVDGAGLGDLSESVACALAVADWLGVPRPRATKAIAGHRADPGAFRLHSWSGSGGARIWFADASAANDPESTDRLADLALEQAGADGPASESASGCNQGTAGSEGRPRAKCVLVVANRPDRPDRALLFVNYAMTGCSQGGRYDEVAFMGPLPLQSRLALRRSGIRYRFIQNAEALDDLDSFGATTVETMIVAAGNRGGPGKDLHAWALARAGRIVTE
ncbi:MAG: hypothetical protein E4H20_03985 [Spirochaetales bacterium]|nr:MAG: hypothetical protein E4H20_03985 [Spirochaetales bacterium]